MIDASAAFNFNESQNALHKLERPLLVFSRFLRYFVEVAQQGSIRRASERLNVSASAIDRQILHAEHELGAVLFERLPTGLKMTAAGEMLLASARAWMKDYTALKDGLADLQGLRRGFVRLACIEALTQGFAPRLIADLREEFPGVSISVDIASNYAVADRIASGEADFGLMLNPQASKDLLVRASVEIETGLATPVGHALQARPSVRLSELADLPMVVPAPPLALADLVRALVHAAGLDIRPAATANNIQMIKSLVGEGAGIGILSWLDVMGEVTTGQLGFVPIADARLRPMHLCLCVSPHRQLSHAAQAVLSRTEGRLSEVRRDAAP